MSYNSYPNSTPNYSSYLQQPVNGRSQFTDQSRNTYPSNSYQPSSAYQMSQRPPTYTPSSNSSSNTNNYQDYGSGTSDGRSQNTRAGFNDGRSSVDTTALGNLAYASSLPRDSTTPTQATTYNSNHSGYRYPSAYGVSSAPSYQYNTDHGRTSAQPILTSRPDSRTQGATASPSLGYSANMDAQAQTQGPSNNITSQSRQAYSAAQQYQTSQFNKPPSRPSSVQAMHQAHSRNGSQGLQSPRALVNTTISSSERTQQNRSSPIGNARIVTPNQQTSQQPTHQPPTAQSHNSSKTSSHAHSVSARDTTQPAVRNKSSDSPSVKASTPVTNQSFATVDPSQVFNDVEYQRRQAAAAEAEAARKKTKEGPASNQPSRVPSVAPTNNDVDLKKKNQMELEMKTMIEKMRDYKSKDPSLFSQIWEQVKKGQPTPRASTQSQSAPQAAAVSPVVVDGQLPSTGPQAQLPPESELPAAATEPFPIGFDRGRFPAQRRRRGGGNYTPPKKPATPKGPSSTAPPLDPVQKAMQVFHSSIESSKPPVTPPVAQMVETRPATTYSTVSNQPSTSLAAGLPKIGQPPKAGGTYWPEDKKRQLAQAAKNELTSQPRNAGKNISTDDLHVLLDQNPSYTQMCEILESRGFTIDRGQFARQLLAAVPDLSSASSKVPSTAPVAPPPSLSFPPPAARPWLHSVRRDTPDKGYVTPYMSSGPPGQTPQGLHWVGRKLQGQQQYMQPDHGTNFSGNGPGRAPNPLAHLDNLGGPPTKQDLARKRSFGDIVDLTQGMSDDEDEPPSQRLRTEEDPPQRAERPSPLRAPDQASLDARVGKDGTSLDGFRFNPTDTPAGKYIYSPDIIQPMNKRRDALRRSSYDPKTIARDILVALGKHPTIAPLNAHLERLRETFTAVNHDSDLDTFRWDLIDPGGPPPLSKKVRSPKKDVKPRPSITVMVGDGKSKVMRQGKGLKPTRGGHSTALARSGGSSTQSSAPFDLSRYVNNDLPALLEPITGPSAKTMSSRPYEKARASSSYQSSTPAYNATSKQAKVESSSPFIPSGPRRVGRPPGAKNKHPRPDRGKPKGSKSISTPAQKETTPAYREDVPLDEADKDSPLERETAPQPLVDSIPNRPRVQTTPAKPSGLKNAMSPTDGIAVVIPSRSPSIAFPSRASSEISSKNRRLSIVNGDKNSPEYSHTVYKCRWEGCPAELHDLDTLKKHIRMKHRRLMIQKGNSLLCLWKDCYASGYTDSHRMEEDRLSFEDEKAWDRHVEGVHVEALAKELASGSPDKRRTSHSLYTTTSGKAGKLSGLGWSPAGAKPMVFV